MTRTPLSLSLLLASALASLLLASCGDAGTRYQTGDDPCGPGEQSELIPELLCVYPQAVVIETGFECPAQAAHRFDHGDVTLCSADPGLSPQQQEDIVRDFRQRHPELQTGCNTGANPCPAGLRCQDQLCIPDDACADNDGDGFCAPDDCDDADATIFPGAPELQDGRDNDCDGQAETATCALDLDCSEREVCVRGICMSR